MSGREYPCPGFYGEPGMEGPIDCARPGCPKCSHRYKHPDRVVSGRRAAENTNTKGRKNLSTTIYDVPVSPDDPNCSTFRGRPLSPTWSEQHAAQPLRALLEPILRRAERDARIADIVDARAAIHLLDTAAKWNPPTYASQTYRVVLDPEPFDD